MTYDLRPATIDGEACSTCEYAVIRFDRYDEPWLRCSSFKTSVSMIHLPDETVCDAWRAKP